MIESLAVASSGLVSNPLYLWVGFNVFVLAMLALDLFVFHKRPHEVRFKEAMGWSIFWIALGLAFSVVVYFEYDARFAAQSAATAAVQPVDPSATPTAAEPTAGAPTAAPTAAKPVSAVEDLAPKSAWDAVAKYITGYLIEKSLSVDNLFVFLVIFRFFQIPPMYQHRVLFWGIVGALIFRAIFIFAGVALLARFHWLIYVFGGLLVLTGLKLAWTHGKKDDEDLSKNWVVRGTRWLIPVTDKINGDHFFIKEAGKWIATPLFVALLVVEATDIIFAVDSIPAILAITTDPFIVFTSNVFAILGMRALYFALAGFMNLFVYLGYGLAVILVFIGVKMLMIDYVKIPTLLSLGFTGGVLALSVLLSVIFPPKKDSGATPTAGA